MTRKTHLIVLHKKEIVYTLIFALFSLILITLLFYMFSGKAKKEEAASLYYPGIYTSSINFGEQALDICVAVDSDHINDIQFVSLNESVQTMYPLFESCITELSSQIIENQSLDNIRYGADNQYTSALILDGIKKALSRARILD